MRSHPSSRLLGIPILLIAACGGGGGNADDVGDDTPTPDGPPSQPDAHVGTFLVSGSVDPSPGPGPAMVFWQALGPTKGFYKLGQGPALAGTFSLEITGTPPPEGRVQIGDADFGLGQVVLFPSGTTIPDGLVQTFPAFTGIAGQHAIIYRAPDDAGTQPAWVADFPIGMSCGRCVPSTTGFDSFAPAPCDAFAIGDLGSDVCEWF